MFYPKAELKHRLGFEDVSCWSIPVIEMLLLGNPVLWLVLGYLIFLKKHQILNPNVLLCHSH